MAHPQIDPRLFPRASSSSSFQAPHLGDASQSPLNQEYDSPQQNHPQTPQSGGDTQNGARPNDPKRPRACEACRGLKVRCDFEAHNPDGPCKRCAKANRACVVTAPSRKRQKKTDSRVAELEKKIDALTQTLHAQRSGSGSLPHGPEQGVEPESFVPHAQHNPYQKVTNGGNGLPYPSRPSLVDEWASYSRTPEIELSKQAVPPMVMAGQKRKHTESRNQSIASGSPNAVKKEQLQFSFYTEEQRLKKSKLHEYSDVVDRGVITSDMASTMFNCYVTKMAPHMPAVVFPPGTTAGDIRKSKPNLFLAILSAASGAVFPEVQRALTKEVMSLYAERIICNGEKTLELIQALQISTLWYWPPEHFEELKFYQLIHIAAVMAIDIGMGKKNKSQRVTGAGLWRDHPWRRTPYPDPECLEARRAWIACYFLCCNASMGLRRPNLVRWTPFMAECVERLENSPEAAPSDRSLCEWVRGQHIAEDVGEQFSMDDPVASVSISDPKVQYALKGFERDLEKWGSHLSSESYSPSMTMYKHCVSLYMHEVAMHVDHNVDEFQPPFTEDNLRAIGENNRLAPLSTAHISALSACLTSIDGTIESFISMDIDTIRCLPVGNFVRVAYAVVVLIKMYFAAAIPNSELGKVIDKDNMKVEQHLDGLVEIFRAAATEDKSRPSAKFLMVLLMLKTWFHRQREGKRTQPMSREEAESTNHLLANEPSAPSNDKLANTPLQLLSEVASAGQARAGSSSNFSAGSSEWQPQTPSAGYPSVGQFAPPQGYGNINTGQTDMVLGMDLGYNMGDGFEQAMGMTLGVGDFGNFFANDEGFYTGLDGAGFSGF